MSPRPKRAPDAQILDAAARLLASLGPGRLRLEDVAREVGLAPATLLLRFKSKRQLLLAVAEHSVAGMAAHFQARRQAHPSPLHVVTEVCDFVRAVAEEPRQLAHMLAFLQLSLEDAEFGACAERHDAALQREIARLLDEAHARGELGSCSTNRLSRAVIALVRGSLLTWSAIGRHVSPERWIRDDLETLLAPYRERAMAAPGPAARGTRQAAPPLRVAGGTRRRASVRAAS